MQVLLRQGAIPNSLMPVVQKALREGQRGQELDPAQLMSELTEDKLDEYMKAMDAIIMAVVVQPKILPVPMMNPPGTPDGVVTTPEAMVPVPDDERDQSAAYIDWIDEVDKVFLMQFATGGTADAEKFRGEFAQFVGAAQPSEDLQVPAEQPTGD